MDQIALVVRRCIKAEVKYWKRAIKNNYFDDKDLKQEFELKIIEKLQYLQNIPTNELHLVVTTILKNKARQLINGFKKKYDTSSFWGSKLTEDIYMCVEDDEEDKELKKITNLYIHDRGEDREWQERKVRAFNELMLIMADNLASGVINVEAKLIASDFTDRLVQKLNGRAKELIQQYLSPSEEIWEKWIQLSREEKSYEKYEWPPIVTIGKLMGLHYVQVARHMKYVRKVASELMNECV